MRYWSAAGKNVFAVFAKTAKAGKKLYQVVRVSAIGIRRYVKIRAAANPYLPEYAGYFQALVDSAVFTDDMITSEMATQVDNDIKALELGISAEKDSILFYYEMKDVMPKQALPTINRVIAEEKSHLRQLSEIKRRLAEASSQE